MVSPIIMLILIVFYCVLIGTSLFDGKPGMALYWLGAVILNVGVLVTAYK